MGAPDSDQRWQRLALSAVLIVSTVCRSVHLDVPLLNGMALKQVFIAHKARSIAGPPFSLLNNSFDFLQEDGRRLTLTEEFPLYTGLLAVAYRTFGELEWMGRLFSSVATLIACVALHDLVRREFGRGVALWATTFFAFSPLLLFYGQAVQPDACMLACMLLACCAWSRFLERGGCGWWLAAAAAAMLAGLFKYFGLVVLLPLAGMTFRAHVRRIRCWTYFLALAIAATSPLAAWTAGIFLVQPNPARHGSYFLFQMPELLIRETLYLRFVDRFLYKDFGPIGAAFLAVGVMAAALGRNNVRARPILGWTGAGLGFYFLFAPQLRFHDYYELMMLPAASVWAALGFNMLLRMLAGQAESGLCWRRTWLAGTAWTLTILVQSPPVMRGKFNWDRGYLQAAQRIQELTTARERVVVIGGYGAAEVLHYAHREGWALAAADLPDGDQQERILSFQELGARLVVVQLNPELSPKDRRRCLEIIGSFRAAEHYSGPWLSDGRDSEFFIASLNDPAEPAVNSAHPVAARR
jgi:hypothetical protein